MSFTTYAELADAIRDVSITGVSRQFDGPPTTVNSTDLPASFPAFPQGDENPITMGGARYNLPRMEMDLVILQATYAEDKPIPNFNDTIDLMDNVAAALRGLSAGSSALRFTLETVIYSGTHYAVVARVTANG